jgi:hypothetical protein
LLTIGNTSVLNKIRRDVQTRAILAALCDKSARINVDRTAALSIVWLDFSQMEAAMRDSDRK